MTRFNLSIWATAALCLGFGVTSCTDEDGTEGLTIIPDEEPTEAVQADGFYVVNEDWYGHDNGTVNLFKQTGTTSYEASYRAYRAANSEEQLGVTAEYGTIWDDNFYILSKQGNRLVVADAETMKKKAVLTEIGGDGRGFVGIDDTKAYVGHSKGIAIFDIATLSITGQIADVSDQTGMMCYAEGRVFVATQKSGLVVIDAATDKVEKTIEGTYYTLTRSKDGSIWASGSNGLTCINPSTFETQTIAYPSEAKLFSTWGAWNAGSLCASTQNNVLYWAGGGSMWGGGKTVYKYDIASGTGSVIYSLGKNEYDKQLAFYGAGLRVDPLSDNLVLTVYQNGYGANYAYNWIYLIDNAGTEITHFELQGDNGTGASWAASNNQSDWNDKYFWFPAVPVFKDANKPQILLNQIVVAPGETKEIDLDEKVVDYDNIAASIQMSASLPSSSSVKVSMDGHVMKVVAGTVSGITTCHLTVISNGVRVEKDIQIAVE